MWGLERKVTGFCLLRPGHVTHRAELGDPMMYRFENGTFGEEFTDRRLLREETWRGLQRESQFEIPEEVCRRLMGVPLGRRGSLREARGSRGVLW